MESQPIQVNDDSRQNEITTWTDAEEKCFIDLMVQQVKANNRPTSSFDTNGWNFIMENFNKINKKAYNKEQFENKYHQLKKMHNNYYSLTNHTGVTVDPQTKRITANECVWDHLYLKYSWVEQMRKKGCPHLEELDFIFSETSAAGEMAFGNKELEHVSEAQDLWDSWTPDDTQSESTAQSNHDTPLSSDCQIIKKTEHSSNIIFYALQTWTELNKSKLKLYNLKIEEIMEARQQMQSKKRDTSVTRCMEVVNEIYVRNGIGIEQVMATFKPFRDEYLREIFLAMSPDLQVDWLKHL
ncbi:PREDICTED: L10-interacting MYB domain-containing protein-like isoform X2 [Nelumbo nucifera]|nr:PREDICTED: L10-interacting MYB domain-containing protein-like isoform X2 [Nelumbo nucifera]